MSEVQKKWHHGAHIKSGSKKHAKFVKQKKKAEKRDFEEKQLNEIEEKYEELIKANPATLKTFDDFPLSWRTKEGLKEGEYTEPTEIQRDSLPYTLSGSDVVGAAKTGSGKTLALVVPVLEALWRARWQAQYGLGALIISPTRELALQTFATINEIGKHHEFSCALLIGGSDVEYEKSRIARVNIIVCTPGRLLQHMDENEQMHSEELQILVLDEADRMLDMGFAKQLNAIVGNLPRKRQTLLFSATPTRNVKDLCRVCTRDPVFISVHEKASAATPDNLRQSYVICEEQDKVNTLWSFVVAHKKKKTLVFVSSCKQARFLTQAFCHMRPGVSVMGLWGTMNQKKRIETFQKFDERNAAVMIATDVASRGLDFNRVDWVIQVDCPATVDDYIHRAGRSARMNEKGDSVVFLTPSQQESMVDKLKKQNIPIEELVVDPKAMADVRVKLRAALAQSSEMKDFAQKSIVAYLRSLWMMQDKKVFDVRTVDAAALADSYGLVSVPRVRFLTKNNVLTKDKAAAASFETGPTKVNTETKTKKKQVKEVVEDEEEESDEEEDRKDDTLVGKFSMQEDGEDEGLFVVKKKNVFGVGEVEKVVKEEEESDEEAKIRVQKGKPLRKAVSKQQIAKKILNKKVRVNTVTTFAEEGDGEATTATAVTDIASVGLDIEAAKEDLKAVDKEDRKRFREYRHKKKVEKLQKKDAQKRKATDEVDFGESDDEHEPDLDWLPDPDEVRKRYAKGDDESDDEPADFSKSSLVDVEQAALQMLQAKRRK